MTIWQYDNTLYKFVNKIVYRDNNIVNKLAHKCIQCIVILSYCRIVIIVSILYILSGIVNNIVVSINNLLTNLYMILSHCHNSSTVASPNLLNCSSSKSLFALYCCVRVVVKEVYEVVHVHQLMCSSLTMSWEYAKNQCQKSETTCHVLLKQTVYGISNSLPIVRGAAPLAWLTAL
jgi:hypothetical protein